MLGRLIKYACCTQEKHTSFNSHALDYRLLGSHAHTWICKTYGEAAAEIIGQPDSQSFTTYSSLYK